jgi:hypothetical protein
VSVTSKEGQDEASSASKTARHWVTLWAWNQCGLMPPFCECVCWRGGGGKNRGAGGKRGGVKSVFSVRCVVVMEQEDGRGGGCQG